MNTSICIVKLERQRGSEPKKLNIAEIDREIPLKNPYDNNFSPLPGALLELASEWREFDLPGLDSQALFNIWAETEPDLQQKGKQHNYLVMACRIFRREYLKVKIGENGRGTGKINEDYQLEITIKGTYKGDPFEQLIGAYNVIDEDYKKDKKKKRGGRRR